MILRDYQTDILCQITQSQTNDFVQLETGGGKTVIIAQFVKLMCDETIHIIAHRDSIIAQICATLEKFGITPHVISGNQGLSKKYKVRSRVNVCSVAAAARRGLKINGGIVIIDEAHHAIKENIWGKLIDNVRVIGFSATPNRLDNKPLDRDHGGLFDRIVNADSIKDYADLVKRQVLCSADVYAPHNKIDFKKLKISNGDYSINSIVSAISRELIFGDFISERMRLAKSMQTLVFCPSILNAEFIAEKYKNIGVPATYIASNLSKNLIETRINAFKKRDVEVLVNVEMITEGFDLECIRCLQILRPTKSIVLHKQMLGRVLRAKKDGSNAVIIDHVGNCISLCMPETKIIWSLNGPPEGFKSPVYSCKDCGAINNLYSRTCFNCGGYNHLLKTEDCCNDQFLEAGFIDAKLVLRERNIIYQEQIADSNRKNEEKRREDFSKKIQEIRWSFNDGYFDEICERITRWFINSLSKNNNIKIEDINKFLSSEKPKPSWFSSNFSRSDIGSENHQKCEKVFRKWVLQQ